MIGAKQKGLQVADGNMYPGQPFPRHIGRCYPCGVTLGFADPPQGGQLVATHQLAGWQVALHKSGNRLLGDGRYLLHGNEPGAGIPVLDGDQNRHLAFGTPPTLPRPTATHQGIVNLDQVVQAVDTVPVPHGDANLAQHPVGRDPRHAYLFGQAQGQTPPLSEAIR